MTVPTADPYVEKLRLFTLDADRCGIDTRPDHIDHLVSCPAAP